MATHTLNPWLALDVATDPVAHARRLRRAHERALGSGDGDGGVLRPLVRESWQRCLRAGVNPGGAGAPMQMSPSMLASARERSPLGPVLPTVQALLSSLDTDARHIVAIGDEQATLLWVSGDPRTCERARAMRFQEGAAWSEEKAGTNALGTAAALDHPVQIFSAEHLLEAVHPWTCSAAPIHDPVTGELIGVVDVTAGLRTNHPHTLSLAALAAAAAENTLRVHSLRRVAELRERWERAVSGRRRACALVDRRGRVLATQGAGFPSHIDLDGGGSVTLDGGRAGEVEPLGPDGAIVWLKRRVPGRSPRLRLGLLGHDAGARLPDGRVERAPRTMELLAVLAMHPEGMTAEQLALALYGERGKAVTIRAQVHRVRAALGAEALSTHPYRLDVGIEADWLGVERLVRAGDPRQALRAYPGPLLPASEAPAIVEARDLLAEALRRAILTTGDPDLLSRWLRHPAGSDDLAAARALVAVLPAGDPRRAAATAMVSAIGRRLASA